MFGIIHDPQGRCGSSPIAKKARRLIPIKDILKVMDACQGRIGPYWVYWHYWWAMEKRGVVLDTWGEDIIFR
jgi:hypothetical protein